MEEASLFCREYFLFFTYLPPTKTTCWVWSLQLDFKLQELSVQEIFFCVMLSVKRKPFSRIDKYYHWPQWKQNTHLPECSMKASKSKGKQVGESKSQDIKLKARRQRFTELNLLIGIQGLPRSPGLLWSPVQRDGHLWGGAQQTCSCVGGDMNCHVLGQFIFHFSRKRIQQLLHKFKLQDNSIHKPMLRQYGN